MLLSAFHREMVRWTSDEIEEFPRPFEGEAMINQPVSGIGHAQVQIFDCLEDGMEDMVVEASDIMVEEKGQSEYERRMEVRKQNDLARKEREKDNALD